MKIDFGALLEQWFFSEKVKTWLYGIVREAMRAEIRAVLDEELLDTKQAAKLLGMSEAALRKAVEREQIPCTRIGGRLRFRRSELLRNPTP